MVHCYAFCVTTSELIGHLSVTSAGGAPQPIGVHETVYQTALPQTATMYFWLQGATRVLGAWEERDVKEPGGSSAADERTLPGYSFNMGVNGGHGNFPVMSDHRLSESVPRGKILCSF